SRATRRVVFYIGPGAVVTHERQGAFADVAAEQSIVALGKEVVANDKTGSFWIAGVGIHRNDVASLENGVVSYLHVVRSVEQCEDNGTVDLVEHVIRDSDIARNRAFAFRISSENVHAALCVRHCVVCKSNELNCRPRSSAALVSGGKYDRNA